MPRSQYVYVAIEHFLRTGHPVGVWTVKREMMDALHQLYSTRLPTGYMVVRFLDGMDNGRHKLITDEVNELMAKGRAAWS